MTKTFRAVCVTAVFSLILAAAGCGSKTNPSAQNPIVGKVIASAPAGGTMTATLSSENGQLKTGSQDVMLAFTDAAGKPVDAGAASLSFFMPAMGSMAAMNNSATLTTTGTPGVYKGKTDIPMAGEWQARVTYEGAAGSGKASMPVTAR